MQYMMEWLASKEEHYGIYISADLKGTDSFFLLEHVQIDGFIQSIPLTRNLDEAKQIYYKTLYDYENYVVKLVKFCRYTKDVNANINDRTSLVIHSILKVNYR